MNPADRATDFAAGRGVVSVDLLAKFGEAVASASLRAQSGWPDAPAAAAAELAQLEGLGLQLQEAARVLAGPGSAMLEQVDLGVAALQARAEWLAALARRGARLTGPEHGCIVLTNPAVLKQLLDLALGHAVGLGDKLVFEVVQRGEPAQAAVLLTVSRGGGELFAVHAGEAAEFHWALLSLLARHCGVVAERQVNGLSVTLTLAFRALAELSNHPAPVSPGLPTTPMPPGCRVLLLEPHEPTRLLATHVMNAAGLHVAAAATVDAARAALLQSLPDCLVTGIEAGDPNCALLLGDLRARQPGLRVLEVSDQPYVFATSLPAAGAPARVARGDLERSLVAALAQELTAAR